MPAFISLNCRHGKRPHTLITNIATLLTLLLVCLMVPGCEKEGKEPSKADTGEASTVTESAKKASTSQEEKKAADGKVNTQSKVESATPPAKQASKKTETPAKNNGGASWQQMILPLSLVILSLVLLILLILTLAQVVAVKRQLRVVSANLKREMDELRSGVQVLPKLIAQILERRIEDQSLDSRDNALPSKTYGDTMAHSMQVAPIPMQSPEAKSVIDAFLGCASGVHPVGGIIRVRLDVIARMANCSTLEVRGVLASANSAYSTCSHPILRRQNFLSVVESRSDTPGESPYVAAISQEALQAMKEHSPN